jgi:hypothetical protein
MSKTLMQDDGYIIERYMTDTLQYSETIQRYMTDTLQYSETIQRYMTDTLQYSETLQCSGACRSDGYTAIQQIPIKSDSFLRSLQTKRFRV